MSWSVNNTRQSQSQQQPVMTRGNYAYPALDAANTAQLLVSLLFPLGNQAIRTTQVSLLFHLAKLSGERLLTWHQRSSP